MKSQLADELNLGFPIFMAPMFLVSNESMIAEGIKNGIAGCFPTLNYRTIKELARVIDYLHEIKQQSDKGNFGVNLIVQKTNVLFKQHLQTCVEHKVPFYVTSLGNPQPVIDAAKSYGAKVYCDVTNNFHAEKVYKQGCDGFIAVSSGAGGHAGNNPLNVLVNGLRKNFPDKPVVASGGIANGSGILSALSLGADAVYIGTRFIASKEADVSIEYKNAIIRSGMDDIVMTERLSGTPCAIINTDYAKKIGYKQNWFEKALSQNSKTKKYFKMLVQYRGLTRLEKSVKPGNYNNLWTAGKSVELIEEILSCKDIIEKLRTETYQALEDLNHRFQQ